MVTQPQMQVKSGAVDGCGVRIIAIPTAGAPTKKGFAVDASFNIYADGVGMVKAGVIKTLNGNPTGETQPISNFWLKANGAKATAPNAVGVLKSPTPKGYLFYATELSTINKLFSALLEQEPVLLSIRRTDEDMDRTFAGTAVLSDTDRAQVMNCLNDLAAEIRGSALSEPAPPKN
ncbi:MAG: hypothetical protein AB9M53_08400 [Leptothrix sp. (in: b-proteobacteria)]